MIGLQHLLVKWIIQFGVALGRETSRWRSKREKKTNLIGAGIQAKRLRRYNHES